MSDLTRQSSIVNLKSEEFDLLVVGGGIYGAFCAWDAALRGLKVVLVEQNTFGSGTSANSLKFIHGGLRYLQNGNLVLARRMARERATWLRIAPDVVKPIEVRIKTQKSGKFRVEIMRMAMMLNNLVSTGDVPKSRVVDGYASWWDGQIVDSERLLRGVIDSAEQHPTSPLTALENTTYDKNLGLNAKTTIITGITSHEPSSIQTTIANNIIVPKMWEGSAIGLPASDGQLLFFVPWQNKTMIGTYHHAGTDKQSVSIQKFLRLINSASPKPIAESDILQIHKGKLPGWVHPNGTVKLLRESKILHLDDSTFGLMGVKYTTARWTAEKAIDLVCKKLDNTTSCQTATQKLTISS